MSNLCVHLHKTYRVLSIMFSSPIQKKKKKYGDLKDILSAIQFTMKYELINNPSKYSNVVFNYRICYFHLLLTGYIPNCVRMKSSL